MAKTVQYTTPPAELAEESLTRPGFLQHSSHTNSISNSAILRNYYISLLSDLCACIHVNKRWYRKGSHSFSVSGSNCLVFKPGKKQWACALLSKKCCFVLELARLKKKKKKEKHFGRLATFRFGTLQYFLEPMGVSFVMKTLEDEWYWCYNSL